MNEMMTLVQATAREAGAKLRAAHGVEPEVNEELSYDIKLALDVETQDLISERILAAHPDHAIFGEEGIAGNQESPWQWIVDPIDGTVNFFYGIPHFCVSIGLRHVDEWRLGVIYDPMMDEMYSVVKGSGAFLNGKPMKASQRDALARSVVTIGFSKTEESMLAGMKRFGVVSKRVRKVRILGSAALALAYVACGRLDAYVEEQINLWDIAAGVLLVEAAGGKVRLTPLDEAGKFSIVASAPGISAELDQLLEETA